MRHRILIVDDDVSLLDMLREMLTASEQYEVMTADRGQRALAIAATFGPDLIILDMTMPGMGGVEFLREISNPDGSLRYPVLVMTSRANMAGFFADVPVAGFVAKPCDLTELRREVERILALRQAKPALPAEPANIVAKAAAKVLLGEDDALVAKSIAAAFTRAGHSVECATTGPMLLEMAIASKPAAIVTKLILSNLNGDAVARMLKNMPGTNDIPVVLYDGTRTAVGEARPATVRPEVSRYVKSDDAEALLAALAAVLARA